jgi:hypothetical protein
MYRLIPFCSLLVCLALVMGCGPLSRPIPERLNPDDQKTVDDAWNRALTPVAKYDHQTWLDVFVTTYAHEVGVDLLTFRSEKFLKEGKVVMEVFFDRTKPVEDRFIVTVYDGQGNIIRTERYNREEVKRTYDELHPIGQQVPPGQRQPGIDKRLELVNEILPKNQPK